MYSSSSSSMGLDAFGAARQSYQQQQLRGSGRNYGYASASSTTSTFPSYSTQATNPAASGVRRPTTWDGDHADVSQRQYNVRSEVRQTSDEDDDDAAERNVRPVHVSERQQKHKELEPVVQKPKLQSQQIPPTTFTEDEQDEDEIQVTPPPTPRIHTVRGNRNERSLPPVHPRNHDYDDACDEDVVKESQPENRPKQPRDKSDAEADQDSDQYVSTHRHRPHQQSRHVAYNGDDHVDGRHDDDMEDELNTVEHVAPSVSPQKQRIIDQQRVAERDVRRELESDYYPDEYANKLQDQAGRDAAAVERHKEIVNAKETLELREHLVEATSLLRKQQQQILDMHELMEHHLSKQAEQEARNTSMHATIELLLADHQKQVAKQLETHAHQTHQLVSKAMADKPEPAPSSTLHKLTEISPTSSLTVRTKKPSATVATAAAPVVAKKAARVAPAAQLTPRASPTDEMNDDDIMNIMARVHGLAEASSMKPKAAVASRKRAASPKSRAKTLPQPEPPAEKYNDDEGEDDMFRVSPPPQSPVKKPVARKPVAIPRAKSKRDAQDFQSVSPEDEASDEEDATPKRNSRKKVKKVYKFVTPPGPPKPITQNRSSVHYDDRDKDDDDEFDQLDAQEDDLSQ